MGRRRHCRGTGAASLSKASPRRRPTQTPRVLCWPRAVHTRVRVASAMFSFLKAAVSGRSGTIAQKYKFEIIGLQMSFNTAPLGDLSASFIRGTRPRSLCIACLSVCECGFVRTTKVLSSFSIRTPLDRARSHLPARRSAHGRVQVHVARRRFVRVQVHVRRAARAAVHAVPRREDGRVSDQGGQDHRHAAYCQRYAEIFGGR